MNAKDHIQALVDESLLRVEKIGTGNWYWCFGSEASHQRDRVREQLLSEEATVRARVEALRLELVEEKIKGGGDVTDDELVERCELMSDIEIVKTRIQVLKVDLAAYEDGDPLVLQGKYEQIQEMKDAAEVWTDNCYILEGYMRNQLAMIKEESVGLLRECYGTEFIEEQGGLAELS